MQVDPRTNTLIITDLADRLQTASDLIAMLDRAQPQVEIEARIVNTDNDLRAGARHPVGLSGPRRSGARQHHEPRVSQQRQPRRPGRTAQGCGNGGQSPALPGAATSAVGLALGAINGAFNLDVALSALENSGKLRILSTPRVTTQNNVEAEIAQGVKIPVCRPRRRATTVIPTVSYIDAALILKVTPQITAAGTVIMTISVDNGSQGEVAPNGNRHDQHAARQHDRARGRRPDDGHRRNLFELEHHDQRRHAGAQPVPLLKWLFKRDAVSDRNTELMIFITPHIIKG